MEITKDMVERFEAIRAKGRFNMFMDAAKVAKKMKIGLTVYFDIVKNYSDLIAKFGIERRA